ADLVAEPARARLGRLLKAPTIDVVEPTVIEAAQPAVLDAAVAEVGAAVRAVEPEKPDAPPIVTKEHEALAEHPSRQRRAARGQLGRQPDRLPIEPHQVTHRSPGGNLCQSVVVFGAQHVDLTGSRRSLPLGGGSYRL